MNIDFGESPEGAVMNYYKERSEYLCGTAIDISRTDQAFINMPDNTKFDGNCQSA